MNSLNNSKQYDQILILEKVKIQKFKFLNDKKINYIQDKKF